MRTLASFAELADIKLNLISRDSDRRAVNDVVDFENGTLIVNRNNLTTAVEKKPDDRRFCHGSRFLQTQVTANLYPPYSM